jgi:hypothetical protein
MVAIEVQAQSLLTTFSALLGLYEACLAKGHTPPELGLPPLPDPNIVVFEGRLRRDGEIVATASIRRTIREDADWDRAEEDLRQRLRVLGLPAAEPVGSTDGALREPAASDPGSGLQAAPWEGAGAPGVEEPSGDASTAGGVEIPKALLDSIRQLALFHGKEIPRFRSVKEAKEFYRKLREPSTED